MSGGGMLVDRVLVLLLERFSVGLGYISRYVDGTIARQLSLLYDLHVGSSIAVSMLIHPNSTNPLS